MAMPVRIGNCRIRRRSRGHEEEAIVAESAFLLTKFRPLAKKPAVCLLPHERNRARSELGNDLFEPLTVEVAPAQVARAARRPGRGIRQTDSELQDPELLLGSDQPRREAGVVQ